MGRELFVGILGTLVSFIAVCRHERLVSRADMLRARRFSAIRRELSGVVSGTLLLSVAAGRHDRPASRVGVLCARRFSALGRELSVVDFGSLVLLVAAGGHSLLCWEAHFHVVCDSGSRSRWC